MCSCDKYVLSAPSRIISRDTATSARGKVKSALNMLCFEPRLITTAFAFVAEDIATREL